MMRTLFARRRLGAFAVIAVALTVVSPLGRPVQVNAVDPACSYCAGGEYHPITPTRIFETRDNDVSNRHPRNDVAPLVAKLHNSATTPPPFTGQGLGLRDAGCQNAWVP